MVVNLLRPKILIVDDSIVVRMILNKLLSADLNAEVIMASSGESALEKAKVQIPDLVILDIEMPKMNGIDTLLNLKKLHSKLPIIMLSALTEADAEITLKALSYGAIDYLNKQGGFDGGGVPLAYLRQELIPKISAILQSKYSPDFPNPASTTKIATTWKPNSSALPFPSTQRISILAIAVSTGGPATLEKLLSQFPPTLKIPIVIVQHIPAEFTNQLVHGLSKKCSLKILQCQEGLELEPGCVYIAQGGRHMEVRKESGRHLLKMQDNPPENSCRPSGDVLFRSVADVYGNHALGLVLTGMGQDGLLGCEYLKKKGGKIFVQDEATSIIWGMPGAVARAGLADLVLPLPTIAPNIMSLIG